MSTTQKPKKPAKPTEAELEEQLAVKVQQAKKERAAAFDRAYATLCRTYACEKSPAVLIDERGVQCLLHTKILDKPPEKQ